jgi:hypothetical protein
MTMLMTVLPNSLLVSRRTSQEVAVNREEEDSIVGYRAMKAMAGPIEEAMRHFDAMTRLEVSLRVAPVPSAVPALRRWGDES